MNVPVSLLLLLSTWVSAQVAAPDFLCTRSEAGGEILTWENVDNDCGAYQSTDIYRATAEEGPYTLLTSLTDRSITEFREENPTGQQLFYYLEYSYDCPGAEMLRSDTLDSFIPVTPVLRFVSVEENDLVLGWEPSPSPEVSGYVILEVNDAGFTVVDTVGNVDSYRVAGVADDELITRQYRIAAIDPCGNDSPQSRIVTATGLTGSGGVGCDSDIELSTINTELSTVEGTPAGAPELFVSVDSGPYIPTEYVPGPSDGGILIYQLGDDGEEVCFYVQQALVEGDSVRTAVFCTTLDISQPVRPFDLYGAEVIESDPVGLRLSFDATVDQGVPERYSIERAISGSTLVETFTDSTGGNLFTDALFGLGELRVLQFNQPQPSDAITITVSDSCGRSVTTNAVSPVFLTAQPTPSNQAQLEWTPLVNGLEGETTYDVLRVSPDSSLREVTTGLSELTYTDPLPDPAGSCYRIRANFTPADRDTTYAFRSNVACVAGRTSLYVPNVFSPTANQAVNQLFRPVFTVPSAIQGYRLQVFDRWGALYFESTDPNIGWDGNLGGQQAPTGTYVYTLSYQTGAGNLARRSGVVSLIR